MALEEQELLLGVFRQKVAIYRALWCKAVWPCGGIVIGRRTGVKLGGQFTNHSIGVPILGAALAYADGREKIMRTALIAALLLLTATPALAEADWVKVVDSADGNLRTIYVDGSSIRASGAVRRYWARADWVKHPKGWKQTKTLSEDNCATGQTRILQLSVYKVDGTRKAHPASVGPWDYVTPGTVGAAIHNYACGK